MKRTRNVLMLAALVSISILMSCGGGDGDGGKPSLQEQIIDALNGSTVGLNIGNSTFGNATISSGSVTVNASSSGAVTIETGGDLASYIDGGSFSVSADGSLTSVSATADATSGLEFSNFSASVNSDISELSITFTSGEASRTDGIGSWDVRIDL